MRPQQHLGHFKYSRICNLKQSNSKLIHYWFSGIIQMTGSEISMDYDNERTYFRTSTLEYNACSLFKVLLDFALAKRTPKEFKVSKNDIRNLN
jgi:hypothetical protein